MSNQEVIYRIISTVKFSRIIQVLSFVAILTACSPARRSVSPLPSQAFNPDSAVLFAYPGDSVTAREFLYVYEKSNADSSRRMTPEQRAGAIREYLDLYINFRLKVKAAEEAGMDKQTSFQQELAQYRKQLAKPYLVENRVTEQLIQEAYERLKQEVRASHILIAVDENASPADTLKAYQLIDSLRTLALKGASFAMLAEQHSDDPSAASNGGDLGYFSALQMVYPFENAAYTTAAGDISHPFKTRFGYHVVKVQDKRPSQGQVKVAHILVRPQPNEQEGASSEAHTKATQIYEQLQKGADWKDMVERFSEDVATRSSGGELPYFGTGNMMPDFEEAAFALNNTGDISQPIKTRYGWHIIKLIDRQGLAPLSELRPTLERNIERSVRSEGLLQDMVERLKKENGFQPDNENIATTVSSLYANTPEVSVPPADANLFSIRKNSFKVSDFLDFVRQQLNGLKTDSMTAHRLYQQFEAKQIMNDEESHLADKYENYRLLLKEYRDGILLFDIMEQKVWSQASEDSVGLQAFFENHRNKYKWGERVGATLFDAQDEETINSVKKAIQGLKMPLEPEQITSIEKRFNTASPLVLQIHQGIYEKDGYRTTAESVIDQVAWKKGTQQVTHDDRMYYIIIHEVLPPEFKKLDEIKGIVIADYQTYLDKQWIASLRQKYPVEVYENVLQQLIASYPSP